VLQRIQQLAEEFGLLRSRMLLDEAMHVQQGFHLTSWCGSSAHAIARGVAADGGEFRKPEA
jgi:hypothetical protein